MRRWWVREIEAYCLSWTAFFFCFKIFWYSMFIIRHWFRLDTNIMSNFVIAILTWLCDEDTIKFSYQKFDTLALVALETYCPNLANLPLYGSNTQNTSIGTIRALIEFMSKGITIIRWQRGNKWRNVRVRRIFLIYSTHSVHDGIYSVPWVGGWVGILYVYTCRMHYDCTVHTYVHLCTEHLQIIRQVGKSNLLDAHSIRQPIYNELLYIVVTYTWSNGLFIGAWIPSNCQVNV